MKIQLALDRLPINEAIRIAGLVHDSIDWIEVGTSLIKEFGVKSISDMKAAFPKKVIVADVKTIDNAKYEFEMCFGAGADVASVMGVSPKVTIDTCMETAARTGKQVMIDLLNTTLVQQEFLVLNYPTAVFCDHVSKDEQEVKGRRRSDSLHSTHPSRRRAVAGGITLDIIADYIRLNPEIFIIGSAITKSCDPARAAAEFKKEVTQP